MKFLAILLLLPLLALAQEPPKEPTFPTVRLADGRVLRNVTFGRAGADTMVLRSTSGPVAVRYEALPDNVRAEAERRRPGGPRWFAGDTSGNTDSVEGQLFIQTAGAGSYKFGDTEVYAFDLSLLQNFHHPSQGVVRLPRPIHRTTTDADGRFTLKLPKDRPYFIFAQASRLRVAGPDTWTERFEWRVPMDAVRPGKPLLLSGEHRTEYTARLQIEPTP
jgi:hypothetical protein